jgi:hypothetical protein
MYGRLLAALKIDWISRRVGLVLLSLVSQGVAADCAAGLS